MSSLDVQFVEVLEKQRPVGGIDGGDSFLGLDHKFLGRGGGDGGRFFVVLFGNTTR